MYRYLPCLTLVFITGGYTIVAQAQANDALDHFRQMGEYTNPGKYAEMYKGLPTDLNELCHLIKTQLTYPSPGKSEDPNFVTVRQIMAGLKERNPQGLTMDRQPEERLLITCRGHALFLASILKYQGVPARVRVGFGEYVAAKGLDKSVDHWITEVWNDTEQRWMFVDADIQRIDFPRDEFELASDVWLRARLRKVDPEHYGGGNWWGMDYIRNNLCQDFLSILGKERAYGDVPPIGDHEVSPTKEELELLDTIAQWLQNPDDYLTQLQSLLRTHPGLQVVH